MVNREAKFENGMHGWLLNAFDVLLCKRGPPW